MDICGDPAVRGILLGSPSHFSLSRDALQPSRRRRRCASEKTAKVDSVLITKRRMGSCLGYLRRLAAMFLPLLLASAVSFANAAFIPFKNCLDDSIINSDPLRLQFVPLLVSAALDSSSETPNVTITVYGNVTGLATPGPYPPPDDPQWSDPNSTVGKIVYVDEENQKFTTLFARLNLLSFTPHARPAIAFCDSVTQGECPLGPVFNANQSDPSQLHAFSVSYELDSPYTFASLSSNTRVASGNAAASPLACINADITPALPTSVRSVLRFIPLVIVLLVGIATIAAAIYSPWGSMDLFRWTSNYGRDEDLLRLVTPGFGDCLQYIQYIVLTGSLTLDYPGYYQPIVSQASWSTLMFNASLVSHGDGLDPVKDGIYSVRARYGLDSMSQYVGMTEIRDIWPEMVVWLLCIVAGVVLIIQLGFAFRWVHRTLGNVPEEDLQAKNFPFTVGNVLRIVFIYLLLPVVSLSMFQLVVARESPTYTVALAVVLLVVLIGFTSWLLLLIARTRPRSFLFDDLPTVLLYGPLYNTYSDGAAPFAVISVLLTFLRGIAIGAVQPSGVAQVVLLAICEVVLVLTIIAFRPFHYATSMNSYHSLFAFIRCITILLSVAFVPSLDVSPAMRGWIGYVILFLHGAVLIFGFFLNAVQTLIEVIARLAGAGGEGGAEGGAARGGLVKVFGLRQLSRRGPRRGHVPHPSINSQAAMLGTEMERQSTQLDLERPRSFSGSSALLLNRGPGTESRMSAGFDAGSLYGTGNSRTGGSGPYTPTTPGGASGFSGFGPPGGALVGLRQADDPYYRAPRQRRSTLEGASSRRRHGSWTSGDWAKARSNENEEGEAEQLEPPVISGRDTPTPAYLKAPREDPDDLDDSQPPRTDYAVREVDFYYRVRGPALSNFPGRKLKTGPADPTGPVSSATGWLRGFLGGKTKEKGKGFEVVRSGRAPPPGLMASKEREPFPEPYRDEPGQAPRPGELSADNEADGSKPAATKADIPKLPPIAPSGSIEPIELPELDDTHKALHRQPVLRIRPPTLPRKSSRRQSSIDAREAKLDVPHSRTNSSLSQGTHSAEESERPKATQRTLGSRQSGLFPFASKPSSTRSDLVSTHSDDSNNDEARLRRDTLGGSIGDDKNVGYVRQHRASDHVHPASPDQLPISASSAEIVGDK